MCRIEVRHVGLARQDEKAHAFIVNLFRLHESPRQNHREDKKTLKLHDIERFHVLLLFSGRFLVRIAFG